MKKCIELLLCLILVFTLAGCGSSEVDSFILEEEPVTAEEEPVMEELSNNPLTPSGTWQTASMHFGDDGSVEPEHYVQFTASNILYGHLEDGEFVDDYTDEISSIEEAPTGGVRIQAEASTGGHYTYQTALEDTATLEYFETWTEEEFDDSYRGGASLSKCN